MKILGFDTSNKIMTVAVSDGDSVLAEYSVRSRTTHSETLMPNIERILKETDTDISEIEVFALSIGPGSFTGLRIGAATAKALAYANDRKIIGLSSLEVLANGSSCFDGLVVPMMDARNGRVFAGAYKNGETVIEDSSGDLKEFLKKLDGADEKFLFTGDGADVYSETIREVMGEKAVFAPMKDRYSRASSVCELALRRAEKGEFDDYFELSPEYLRPSQAERQKNERK